MQKDSGIQIAELRVDGGAAANNLLLQFQADLLGVPVVRPKITESTALGAAYLAGLAVGYWKDRQDAQAHWEVERVFEPRMAEAEVAHRRGRWRRGAEPRPCLGSVKAPALALACASPAARFACGRADPLHQRQDSHARQ